MKNRYVMCENLHYDLYKYLQKKPRFNPRKIEMWLLFSLTYSFKAPRWITGMMTITLI